MIIQEAGQKRLTFSILGYTEGDVHIAHCLELDIADQGTDPEEALGNLVKLIEAHIQYAVQSGDMGNFYCPAPKAIWDAFAVAQAKGIYHQESHEPADEQTRRLFPSIAVESYFYA